MTRQSFTKASRLLGSAQFSAVFSQARFKVSAKNLLILACPSQGPARLGIVVAKKNVRLAVQRNRIKRLIRESFRTRQEEFGTIDLVVLARPIPDSMGNDEFRAQLNYLFDELVKKLNRKATK